ncbi:MAG: nickel pincer cofactor biosynthesis protein LarC [Thaumarchaeota archaeon]|nr:nickel pincer cofactor biosynthesis protein LarC [Nitrososphaerota archaeon]MDE0266038.1 nickel pincer cofactor biosynthesis protein LarC [Nitrososphaerota archaeon]
MVLVIDPQVAGISGDMFLCALVDMGANGGAVIDGVRKSAVHLDGCAIGSMEFRPTTKNGISATGLFLEAWDGHCDDGAPRHPTRAGSEMLDAVRISSAGLGLSDEARSYASRCVEILVTSESRVHGVTPDSATLHEASDVDTLVDIIGTAVALDDLGLFGQRMVCLPACVGNGLVSFSHGTVSNPTGAILEIFEESGLQILGSQAGRELTTPTGACMLAALSPEPVSSYPCMRVESVGYGAGQADVEGISNVLKLVRGSEPRASAAAAAAASAGQALGHGGLRTERICVLETNVDDVSGEVLGSVVGRLMAAGAKDVSLFPGLTKKNRPTSLISVMCPEEASGRLAGLLMAETGTLGVRISASERIVAQRRQLKIDVVISGKRFEVRYKERLHGTPGTVGRYDQTSGFKIEHDDIQAVSEELHVPFRDAELLLRHRITERRLDDHGRDSDGGDDKEDDAAGTGSSPAGRANAGAAKGEGGGAA